MQEDDLAHLKVTRFNGPDRALLDCIKDYRKGFIERDEEDVIISPVANDQNFQTIGFFQRFFHGGNGSPAFSPSEFEGSVFHQNGKSSRQSRFQGGQAVMNVMIPELYDYYDKKLTQLISQNNRLQSYESA